MIMFGILLDLHCHAERLLHTKQAHGMTLTLLPLSSPTHTHTLSLSLPLSLSPSLSSLQIGKVSAACSCCQMLSDWTVDGLDWTGLGAAMPPKG